jgi:ribosomal-protein-alanine N-acetyltransferase
MTVRVLHATVGDLAQVFAIDRESETAPHWSEAEYARIVEGSGAVRRCLLVAEDAGTVAGYAVGMALAGVGELETVAVRVGARRQGVGRALCAAVLAWCRAEGAGSVELEVRAASAGARRLYEGLGFRLEGMRRGYYAAPMDDAALMRLEFGAGGAA